MMVTISILYCVYTLAISCACPRSSLGSSATAFGTIRPVVPVTKYCKIQTQYRS